MEIKENQLVVTDSEGNEHLLNILFTYDHEERNKSYVFFYDPSEEENIMVMSYTEDGELEEITDDEEYAEIEEVFNAYMEDPEIQKIK